MDEMRLLPDKERAHLRRRFQARPVGHLHPAQSFESLPLSYPSCRTLDLWLVEPLQRALQFFRMSPQGKLRLMPPKHFQMELAKPRIVGQSCFLRRYLASAIHSKEILRQHNPPFQFFGSAVLATAEVHHSSVIPITMPCCSSFVEHLLIGFEECFRLHVGIPIQNKFCMGFLWNDDNTIIIKTSECYGNRRCDTEMIGSIILLVGIKLRRKDNFRKDMRHLYSLLRRRNRGMMSSRPLRPVAGIIAMPTSRKRHLH